MDLDQLLSMMRVDQDMSVECDLSAAGGRVARGSGMSWRTGLNFDSDEGASCSLPVDCHRVEADINCPKSVRTVLRSTDGSASRHRVASGVNPTTET
jgi:hypothetical protein